MNLFGFQILKDKREQKAPASVVSPAAQDGSVVLSSSAAAYYVQAVDMDTAIKNENDLIRRYREISQQTECDAAIEEIVNEAITVDKDGNLVTLNLDSLKAGDGIKKKIQDEFEEIQGLINFRETAHDKFRMWYIDGRQYHMVTLNPDKPKDGILKVDLVDSRKIRKVKKVQKQRDPKTGVDLVKGVEEFFLYNERGITEAYTSSGVKLSVDSVVYTPSGLFDQNSNMMFSYLHKAVKPVNQLKMIEDALVVNTMARAPERRIFYIDVGSMPKAKAEQYVTDIMNKYRNKIVYDSSSGEVRDDRKFQSLLEDFWIPRREGGKSTEITTLQGSGQLINNDLITYFQQKVYQSLNVPIARLQPQQGFSLGRSNEITRDELKFHKFVSRLRNRYGNLLMDLLRVQLIAKNIVTAEDWETVQKQIHIQFVEDNNFVEMRDSELWMNRLQMMQQAAGFNGTFLSQEWIQKNILRFTDEQVKEISAQIKKEPAPAAPDDQEG